MLTQKKKRICLIMAVILTLASFRFNGPYRGRVVELETGKPVEGSVVAATWSHSSILVDKICTAKETLTDKDGNFVLPRVWCFVCFFSPLDVIDSPEVVIFKPGYLGYPPIDTKYGRSELMPDYTGEEFRDSKQFYVIKLGKPKTREERQLTLDHADSPIRDSTLRKLPQLINFINKERNYFKLGEVYKKEKR